MLPDYPLQQRARHRIERLQLAFVDRARPMLRTAHDCVVKPGGRALLLLARSETALETPTFLLREAFGAALEFTRPEVRHVGSPPREPVVQFRVNAPVTRIDAVRRVLAQRGITLQDESRGDTRCLLQGEARLAQVLGMSPELKQVTLGSALLWTTLVRYAPCALAYGPPCTPAAGHGPRSAAGRSRLRFDAPVPSA
jgi:hypothetical protein